ncbi:uncharacterized protein C8A04DRAFT_15354 [Dichotomopilus funicola]|uniref:Uncharacterized protein n=1 Tax=Dichotomopilus funicola TaxID=1934379 RepID=A0AAN6UY33_9PEZI|nr:hypothetical protein C8A04DRAFT_15354 [Dichotomopilus funicola]
MPAPPPPPLPPQTIFPSSTPTKPTTQSTLPNSNNPQPRNSISPPNVPTAGPPNSHLVSLLIYNGYPFADHWEFHIAPSSSSHNPIHPKPSSTDPQQQRNPNFDEIGTSPYSPGTGTIIQAAGDVATGFWLEIKRGWDMHRGDRGSRGSVGLLPRSVPLGWLGIFQGLFARGSDGEVLVEGKPRCVFERILFEVPAPGKTLRAVEGTEAVQPRIKIRQRNCQSWVIEVAERLVQEGLFAQSVVDYLRAASIMV